MEDEVKILAYKEKLKEIWDDERLSPQDKDQLITKYLGRFAKEIRFEEEAKK